MKKLLILLAIFIIGNISFAQNINVECNDNIYHITIKGNQIKKHIKFISSEKLISNKEIHKNTKSRLTVNTGFFDPNNQKTISYIVTDRQIVEDPLLNENLMLNPLLRSHIDKILKRTEFRIVECDNKYHYEIAPHGTKVAFGCNIITSAQGGPQLLPELKLEEEFFILRDEENKIIRQSASVLDKTARTIFGLKNGELHILIITNKNPKTIFEARELCRRLGFEYAMAFDGGSSTSFNYKNIDVNSIIDNQDELGRLLKSFMIIN